jgi:pilus assembly protein CpaF
MEIMVCEILPDGTRQYNSIFQYHITENRYEDGNYTIEGSHKFVQSISPSLQRRLIDNGMPQSQLNAFIQEEVKTA